jgi:hypothetical protein
MEMLSDWVWFDTTDGDAEYTGGAGSAIAGGLGGKNRDDTWRDGFAVTAEADDSVARERLGDGAELMSGLLWTPSSRRSEGESGLLSRPAVSRYEWFCHWVTESWSVSLSSRALRRLWYANVSLLVTVSVTLSATGAAELKLANVWSSSGRDVVWDGGLGEKVGMSGVAGQLSRYCSSKERTLNPSLPEFEFHSNTEVDTVLDLGELVRLSIGTKVWPNSGLSTMGMISTAVKKDNGANQGTYTYVDKVTVMMGDSLIIIYTI